MKKFVLLILVILAACLFFIGPAQIFAKDKELVLIYTGQTHGALYPCNCPVEPDGGVARRAALIKQLRNKYPDALVLDSGNFFSGGLADQNIQNTQLDMQRSKVNLAAMELMKYDAIAIGDDEFNFGKEFLVENLGKTKLGLISANLKSEIVSPYVIKEAAGVKVGIIGLTSQQVKQKSGDQLLEASQAVETSVAELKKKGIGLVILLSNLGEPGDLKIIASVPGISVVIDGIASPDQEPFIKSGGTLILRPSFQGRKLGLAVFGIQGQKISSAKVEELRLSDKIKDDPSVAAMLPRCFSDNECKKDGLVGACANPGMDNSSCIFSEALKVNLTVITTEDCAICNSDLIMKFLKKQFPGLEVAYLNYPDKKAEKLVESLKAEGLPVFLLGKEIAKDKSFNNLKANLIEKDNYYLLKPEISGMSYFLNRQKIKGKFDLFISLFDKDSFTVLNVLREFNPEIHFLAVVSKDKVETRHGEMEAEEDLRAVCVQKYYPKSFWDYITCRSKNIASTWWDDCAAGLDAGKIKTCARSQEGRELLKKNSGLNQEIKVMLGPAYLLDNNQIFASRGAPSKEELKKIIKK